LDPGSNVEIEPLDETAYGAAVPELARLLVDTVDSGASVSFLAGLDEERAAAWWTDRTGLVASGEVVPYVARRGGRIVGVVLLILSTKENSPHRAEIAKVLVHRSERGRGIATALLATAEAGARARGRTLLVLDTVTGSPAERLYARLGWQAIGSIPGYALSVDGRPEAATFMWKELPRSDVAPTKVTDAMPAARS
jgi:GNAT superfamily N-acetyltransferase